MYPTHKSLAASNIVARLQGSVTPVINCFQFQIKGYTEEMLALVEFLQKLVT